MSDFNRNKTKLQITYKYPFNEYLISVRCDTMKCPPDGYESHVHQKITYLLLKINFDIMVLLILQVFA